MAASIGPARPRSAADHHGPLHRGGSGLSLSGHQHLFRIFLALTFLPRDEGRDAAGEERAEKKDEHVAGNSLDAFPEQAEELMIHFVDCLRAQNKHVETGRFGARMEVDLVNDGPLTIMLEL